MFQIDGLLGPVVWRDAEDIIDEIGLAPLDLIAEIQRLDNKIALAYQMANHFHGNGNMIQSNGRPFPKDATDRAWEAAARMLKGTLDNAR